MTSTYRGSLFFILPLLFVLAWSAAAQPMDDVQLISYVSERIEELMERHEIPGASVAIVRGGEVILEKGFGLANVEEGVAADEETVYLLASTSKLFVAIAVLQLVEQGLVDLHADVNGYLTGIHVPETYPEPITLFHLLTHTAGFEEMEGLAPGEPRVPLAEYLATHMPDRVRPPGVAWAYSNYGVALAAHVVEQVTGTAFGEYAAAHIFDPLGMTSTTYDDPLSPDLAARAAVGYGTSEAGWIPVADDVPSRINLAPVGEAKSTASDMARFMLACLGDGSFDGASILGPASAEQLTSPQFRMDERFAGMCYGFHERILRDVRMIHHGGDSLTFHTELLLVPEEDLGLFVAFNGDEGATARLKLMIGLHEELAAVSEADGAGSAIRYGNAERCSGDYLDTRRRYSGPEALRVWWDRTLTFEADALGRLYRPQASKARFVEVAPLVFEEDGGPRTIVFVENAAGEIAHMFMPNFTTESYERLPAWRAPRFVKQIVGAVGLCVLTILAALRL